MIFQDCEKERNECQWLVTTQKYFPVSPLLAHFVFFLYFSSSYSTSEILILPFTHPTLYFSFSCQHFWLRRLSLDNYGWPTLTLCDQFSCLFFLVTRFNTAKMNTEGLNTWLLRGKKKNIVYPTRATSLF